MLLIDLYLITAFNSRTSDPEHPAYSIVLWVHDREWAFNLYSVITPYYSRNVAKSSISDYFQNYLKHIVAALEVQGYYETRYP